MAGSSLKAALDLDWDDPDARDQALTVVLDALEAVETFVAAQDTLGTATQMVALAHQIKDQDVTAGDAGGPTLRRGVAKDRRISIEDADMRHGRKSRSNLFDGYKRHVLRDLDSGLIRAVGITAANIPEAAVTDDISTDLAAQHAVLGELHIDRAYLSSTLVRDRGDDLSIFCKAWRVRNTTGRYPKTDFGIDFTTGQLTCPNGTVMAFEPGKTVRFPKQVCAACPLRQQCTTSTSGRSVSVHPDEALLIELRQRQKTRNGRAHLRERTKVEHALAHIGHWQGKRARYRGSRKTCSTYAELPLSTTCTSSPDNPPPRLLDRLSSCPSSVAMWAAE